MAMLNLLFFVVVVVDGDDLSMSVGVASLLAIRLSSKENMQQKEEEKTETFN